MSRRLPACRSCGADALVLVAPSLHPRGLAFCPACRLVQTTATQVAAARELTWSPELVVRDAIELADRLRTERHLGRDSLVVELGRNDRQLLEDYQRHGIPVLGIEPEAFTRSLAERLRAEGQTADVLHLHDVLGRVVDLNDFVSGIHALMLRTGVTIIDTPYLPGLVERFGLDCIDADHRYAFSLTSLTPLFRRHGLRVDDAQPPTTHGGLIRLEVGRSDSPADGRGGRVDSLLAQEAAWGVAELQTYIEAGRAA